MNDLLTEPQAAEYLGGIPPRTLRQWRYTGKGPIFTKLGRAVRYRRDDLDAWIEGNRHTRTDQPIRSA